MPDSTVKLMYISGGPKSEPQLGMVMFSVAYVCLSVCLSVCL